MSADLSLLSGSTSAASQLALNGTGASGTVTSDTGDTGPFAALFQQLLGKQTGLEAGPALSDPTLTLPGEEAIGAQLEEATETLDTLLPFLEAIGLAQIPSATTATPEVAPALTQTDSTPVVLAAVAPSQVTFQPANSAVPAELASSDNNKLANSAPVVTTVSSAQTTPNTTPAQEDALPQAQTNAATGLAATASQLINQPANSAVETASTSSDNNKLATPAPVMAAVGPAQTDPTAALSEKLANSVPVMAAVGPAQTDPTAALSEKLSNSAPVVKMTGPSQAASATISTEEDDILLTQADPSVQTDSPPVVLATAMTPQVTNQTTTSAVQTLPASGDASKLGNSVPITEGMQAEAPVKTVNPDAGQQSGNMSDDRNFNAQLHAAIEGNREQSPNPATAAGTAHQVTFNASYREALATGPQLPVAQVVGSSNWNDAVGNQIVWMANHQESHAELVLNPPQMGRVEVSLSVTGEQATASFVSSNPAVREALEAALPRLREVLADAGIQLGQAQVGAENTRQSAQQEKEASNLGNNRATQPESKEFMTATQATPATAGLKLGRGLVDVFA